MSFEILKNKEKWTSVIRSLPVQRWTREVTNRDFRKLDETDLTKLQGLSPFLKERPTAGTAYYIDAPSPSVYTFKNRLDEAWYKSAAVWKKEEFLGLCFSFCAK